MRSGAALLSRHLGGRRLGGHAVGSPRKSGRAHGGGAPPRISAPNTTAFAAFDVESDFTPIALSLENAAAATFAAISGGAFIVGEAPPVTSAAATFSASSAFSPVPEISGVTILASDAFTVPSGTGTTNVAIPGTPQQNDIVLVAIANDDSASDNITTTGYTPISNDGSTSTPGNLVAYKRMGATPDSTVAISQDDSNVTAGVILLIRGVDTTTAEDATATVSSTTGAPDPPSLTTVTDGALRLAVALVDDADAAADVTAPTGWDLVVASDTGQGSVTTGCTVAIASLLSASAGAVDPGAFGGVVEAYDAVHLALRPAA